MPHIDEVGSGVPMYALVVESHQERQDYSWAKRPRYVVINGEWGVTSQTFLGEIPLGAMLFDSIEEAEKFAGKWKGHPWWVNPNGHYEIFEVRAITVPKVIGYSGTSVKRV